MRLLKSQYAIIGALFFALCILLGYGIPHRIEMKRQEEARLLKIEYRLDAMQLRVDYIAYQEVKP